MTIPTAVSLANLMPPWQSGQSGNPKGIQSLGRALADHLNFLGTMCENGTMDEKGLRAIVKDGKENPNRRAAALRMLRQMENPDISDFEVALDGKKSLVELRADGVNTELIRKVKTKTRTIPQKKGQPIKEVEREIELHDRSGVDFDRVSDRTEGRPAQTVNVNNNAPPMIVVFGAEPPRRPQLVDESPQ